MKKLQKGFVIPLLVIIIAVFVIGGGAFIYHKNHHNQTLGEVATNATSTDINSLQSTTTDQKSTTLQVATSSMQAASSVVNNTIKEPALKGKYVLQMQLPNGGEYWIKGKTYPITWRKTDDLNNIKVVIGLYDVTGSGVYEIAREIPNTGSLNWTIPDTIRDGKYRMVISQIRYTDGPIESDSTDDYFTIVSPTATESVPAASWYGTYEFQESAEPNQDMVYHLTIEPVKYDPTKIGMELSVDGFQTQQRFGAFGSVVNGKLEMIFTGHPSDHIGQLYRGGSLLFTLENTVSGKLKIHWNVLQPKFDNTDPNDSYFTNIKSK